MDAHRVPRLRSRVRYEKVMIILRTCENREMRQVAARLSERTLPVETSMRRSKKTTRALPLLVESRQNFALLGPIDALPCKSSSVCHSSCLSIRLLLSLFFSSVLKKKLSVLTGILSGHPCAMKSRHRVLSSSVRSLAVPVSVRASMVVTPGAQVRAAPDQVKRSLTRHCHHAHCLVLLFSLLRADPQRPDPHALHTQR